MYMPIYYSLNFLLFSHNKIEQKLEKMQIVIKQHFQ